MTRTQLRPLPLADVFAAYRTTLYVWGRVAELPRSVERGVRLETLHFLLRDQERELEMRAARCRGARPFAMEG